MQYFVLGANYENENFKSPNNYRGIQRETFFYDIEIISKYPILGDTIFEHMGLDVSTGLDLPTAKNIANIYNTYGNELFEVISMFEINEYCNVSDELFLGIDVEEEGDSLIIRFLFRTDFRSNAELHTFINQYNKNLNQYYLFYDVLIAGIFLQDLKMMYEKYSEIIGLINFDNVNIHRLYKVY